MTPEELYALTAAASPEQLRNIVITVWAFDPPLLARAVAEVSHAGECHGCHGHVTGDGVFHKAGAA